MQPDLRGVRVAVLCGDAREVILVEQLVALGAHVQVVGLPVEGNNITQCHDLADGLVGVNAVILPVPGINDQGHIHTAYLDRPLILSEELLALLPEGTPLLVGMARPLLKEMANRRGLCLKEVMRLDEVAILNSIPSAEGAIQMAMEMLPITIHGSSSFVLGFGRTGATLARMLAALGSTLTVVARNPAQRARAFEMGFGILDFAQLSDHLGEADVIFNTVPAPVLAAPLLERLAKAALIVDLASAPGGTDFKAAEKLGIKAVLAPGLPGKVAPKTAGQILARVIPRLLMEELTPGF